MITGAPYSARRSFRLGRRVPLSRCFANSSMFREFIQATYSLALAETMKHSTQKIAKDCTYSLSPQQILTAQYCIIPKQLIFRQSTPSITTIGTEPPALFALGRLITHLAASRELHAGVTTIDTDAPALFSLWSPHHHPLGSVSRASCWCCRWALWGSDRTRKTERGGAVSSPRWPGPCRQTPFLAGGTPRTCWVAGRRLW